MGERESVGTSFYDYLMSKGISRRTFMKFCGGIAAAIGLAEVAAPRVAQALEIGAAKGKLAPVLWLEAGSCSGCTESLAQADNPDVATVVLDLISLNYSETLSAGAGYSLERAKEETIEAGGYVLVYEGSVMTGWDGNALRIAGEKGTDQLEHAAKNAVAVIAAGSCAVDGGWTAGAPNPAGAMGVQQFFAQRGIATPVINIPTCPVNPENILAVVVQLVMAGSLPLLDGKNMPANMYGQTIHENCPRRGHFENGEFVYQFGTVEEEKQYCLYALGCKGPQTYANCPVVRWNRQSSWCVESGAPCCGCGQADPTTNVNNWVDVNGPFAARFRDLNVAETRLQPEIAALGITGVVAAAIAVHAIGMKLAGRTKSGGGADIEFDKRYNTKRRLPDIEMQRAQAQTAAEARRNTAGAPTSPSIMGSMKETDEALNLHDEVWTGGTSQKGGRQ